MATSALWIMIGLTQAAMTLAQDAGLYSGGLQFLPAPGPSAPGQDAGLPQLQYSAPGGLGSPYLLGGGGGGFPQGFDQGFQQSFQLPAQQAPDQDPRTGPLTFGPEHARPVTTTPNPFRQGPLVQAAIQQQRLLQQQQQLALATPTSPSGRYVSLPQDPAPAPSGYGGYGGLVGGFVPSGPAPGQDPSSAYAYPQLQ